MDKDNKKDQEKPQEKPAQSAMDKMLDSFNKLVEFFQNAWQRINHIEQTNMELGLKHMREGNYFDAALRFRYACWKNKNNFIAHYMQGKAYTYAGKPEKAIPPLRIALADNPKLEEARFLLACCGEKIQIDRMPPSLVIEHLDNMADAYDEEVAQTHNLAVNQYLREEIDSYFKDRQGFEVLDLSCRTGDAASAVLEKANYIVGVDPSLKMISKARDKRKGDRLIYNQLVSKLPVDFLKDNDKKFDIITCTFSLFNFGDLEEHFSLVSKTLKPEGVFAFNIVRGDGESYFFSAAEITFKHSSAYIQELVTKHGMEVISQRNIDYENSGADTLFVVRTK